MPRSTRPTAKNSTLVIKEESIDHAEEGRIDHAAEERCIDRAIELTCTALAERLGDLETALRGGSGRVDGRGLGPAGGDTHVAQVAIQLRAAVKKAKITLWPTRKGMELELKRYERELERLIHDKSAIAQEPSDSADLRVLAQRHKRRAQRLPGRRKAMSAVAKAMIDRAAWMRRVDEGVLAPLSAASTEINAQFSPCSELHGVRAALAQLAPELECQDTTRGESRRQFTRTVSAILWSAHPWEWRSMVHLLLKELGIKCQDPAVNRGRFDGFLDGDPNESVRGHFVNGEPTRRTWVAIHLPEIPLSRKATGHRPT